MRFRTPETLWALSRSLHARGLTALARMVKSGNWFLHKCLLPSEAQVGRDVLLEHYALGVVIHPQVRIGNDCRIYHHVTLASESEIGSAHRIVVGNGVSIGAHSIVLGKPFSSRSLGDGAVLGAGSVLLSDIPAGEVWAGNPARKIKTVSQPSPS